MATKKGLLSGEHFSVDGTLIHAWASQKSIRRKDGSDGDRPPEDWHGEPRSNDTHESKTDPESRLYRKSNAASALPSYLGHVLTDNLTRLRSLAKIAPAVRVVSTQRVQMALLSRPGKNRNPLLLRDFRMSSDGRISCDSIQ